ncbi:MAG: hypothetical protein DDT23_01065 [candidate division WS2 bacterium]|nr:hypothetical protein [Candidatus Lithacetigena glycinireducens]
MEHIPELSRQLPKEQVEQIQADGSAIVDMSMNAGELEGMKRTIELAEVVNLAIDIESRTEETIPSYYNEKTLLTGEKALVEMAQVVVDEYVEDLNSRKVWEENTADQIKFFTSFMDKKTSPWVGASNVNLPLLTVAALQFHARAYDALFPSKGVVQVVNTGDEDIERGERVGKFMNFQLYHDIKDYEEGMDKTLLQLPIIGCVFRKTFYDTIEQQVTSCYVSAADFVVNYGAYSLSKASRVTHVIYMDKNDIRKRVNDNIFVKKAWDLSWDANYLNAPIPHSPIKAAIDKAVGEKDVRTYNLPRIILEQHRNWDINGDGIGEPVVITVDLLDKKVLRITNRTVTDETGKGQTIEYFTKYGFIPNPEGFYDLGFGTLIRGLNESANTIVNEVIDAGSLANLQGGFVAKRSGMRKGELKFKMGVYQEVDMHLDDMQKAIYSFNFKGPNQTLYAVLGLLYEYSKLVSSISETMTGQLPASDTPASTVLALIEEGRKVFSSIHKRIHRSFKQELAKIYRLNGIFLDEIKYFKALGDNKVPQGDTLVVGRLDFKGTLDVIPVSDPNITSNAEKIMKAEQALKNVIELDPQNSEAMYNVRKRYFEALEIPNIGELLKPPPPPPDLSQEEENAAMITEKPATVLPHQDHLHHLKVLEDLISGPYAAQLTPTAKKLVERHRLEHVAGHYLQSKQEEGVADV